MISGHRLAQRHWGAKRRGDRDAASTPSTFALTQLRQPRLSAHLSQCWFLAGASGPVKVAAHVGLFIFTGCWDEGSDSPISYPTKQSPNTSSEGDREQPQGTEEHHKPRGSQLPRPQGKAEQQHSLSTEILAKSTWGRPLEAEAFAHHLPSFLSQE